MGRAEKISPSSLIFQVILLLKKWFDLPSFSCNSCLLLTMKLKFSLLLQEALKRRLNARMEYAKFLQDTVKEMAKEVQTSRSGEIKKTAEDLDGFMNKVCFLCYFIQLTSFCNLIASLLIVQVRRGVGVSNDEILGFAKLFNDELTLDNINRLHISQKCIYW